MTISKIWIFKFPDIDQGIEKYVIQTRGALSVFEKSYEKTKKKSNISISRTRYTHKKCLFEYEKQFAVEKKAQKNVVRYTERYIFFFM